MKKRRSKNTPIETAKENKVITEMRGLVMAARAPRARRSLTPVQAQSRIIGLMENFKHEQTPVSYPQRQKDSSRSASVSGRVQADKPRMYGQVLPPRVRDVFQDARRALICEDRRIRREIMFALSRNGKNGRNNRKARWTDKSYVTCSRKGR